MTNDKKQTKQEANKELSLKRTAILNALESELKKVKAKRIDKISYSRIMAGISTLKYELEHYTKFKRKRDIYFDLNSAKKIASMAQCKKLEEKDIVVKKGVDLEIKYLCKFVDSVTNGFKDTIPSSAIDEFITNQKAINKEIQNLYTK